MAAPYEPGERVAFLEPDVDGVRVRDGIVYGTEGSRVGVMVARGPTSELHWVQVNDSGIAAQLVPMDQQISDELARHGDGYLIRPTQRDIYDIAESPEEAVVQMEVRWEEGHGHNHGYGYLCCASPSLRATTAAVG